MLLIIILVNCTTYLLQASEDLINKHLPQESLIRQKHATESRRVVGFFGIYFNSNVRNGCDSIEQILESYNHPNQINNIDPDDDWKCVDFHILCCKTHSAINKILPDQSEEIRAKEFHYIIKAVKEIEKK